MEIEIGWSLQKLIMTGTWTAASEVDKIKQLCRNLRRASLQGRREDDYAAIASLLISPGAIPIEDGDLWEKVGDTLESLTLKCVERVSVDQIENIGKFCRTLRHLEFFDSGHRSTKFSTQLSQLLCSLGEQLEFAYLYDMHESDLLNIAKSCNNCCFHLRTPFGSPVLPSLFILGHQLESARIGYGSNERDFDKWTFAWDECVNLRELRVDFCNVDDIKAIMSSLKSHLEVLNTRMFDSDSEVVKEVLDICSKGCGNVQHLEFMGSEHARGSFDKFVEKNKSSYSSLRLYIEPYGYKPDKYHDLIQPFLESSVFTEICIDNVVSAKTLETFKNCQVLIQGKDGPCYPSNFRHPRE